MKKIKEKIKIKERKKGFLNKNEKNQGKTIDFPDSPSEYFFSKG